MCFVLSRVRRCVHVLVSKHYRKRAYRRSNRFLFRRKLSFLDIGKAFNTTTAINALKCCDRFSFPAIGGVLASAER